MATISEITLDQLASVDAKLLFKALEMRLASAGVIKKRGAKKAAASSSSSDGDDAASETSRSVGEGTKKWNDQTKVVAALVKEALAGQKGGAGFHLKVLSYLKTEKSLSAEESPSLEQVAEAVTFLKENPEWTSPNQKAKAAKAEAKPSEGASAGSDAAASSAAAASAGPKIVVKKAEEAPKKKGRPAKSAEEKEAEAAAKKAAKEAEAAAKKAAKAAEKEAKKAEKAAAKKAPAAAKKAAEAPAEVDAEEESELVEIELEGVSYFWDSDSGAVFENIDGHTGEKIGSWDGASNEISKDE